MSINLIQKSLIPLIVSTLLLGVFYWQFTYVYAFLIENFTKDKLSVLYFHLFIYSFLVLILFISLINLLNFSLIKSKNFHTVTISVLLFFYTLSYSIHIEVFQYLLNYPLSDNSIMGAILFVVGTFSYTLYSLVSFIFNKFIPLTHILIFTMLGVGYAVFFINTHCYPVVDILIKF